MKLTKKTFTAFFGSLLFLMPLKVNATSLEPSKVSENLTAESERQKIVNFGHTSENTAIFSGDSLLVGTKVQGPAIIEEPTSTLVVYPGSSVVVSDGGRYIISV